MITRWLVPVCLIAGAALLAARPAGSALRRLRGDRTPPAVRRRSGRFPAADARRSAILVVAVAAGAGLLLGGPVAAVIGVAYAALAMIALARRSRRRRDADARTRSLDDLCALAADLRAGLPPAMAGSPIPDADHRPEPARSRAGGAGRVAELTAAVWRLAERTGAPAADLVERIEADARAADRANLSAAAQAAGAQATALLLAALPLGGIGLGYSIGVDPLQVLFRTPLGAGCAIGAVVLQCAGLAWSARLVTLR